MEDKPLLNERKIKITRSHLEVSDVIYPITGIISIKVEEQGKTTVDESSYLVGLALGTLFFILGLDSQDSARLSCFIVAIASLIFGFSQTESNKTKTKRALFCKTVTGDTIEVVSTTDKEFVDKALDALRTALGQNNS